VNAKGEKGKRLLDLVVLMLCSLPFIVLVSPIALLLGQPSPTVTILLWVGMVVLILVLFGVLAWRFWKPST
jgi:hypothetical protein